MEPNAKGLDARLAGHILNAVAADTGGTESALASDKAWVCGLPFHNGLFTYPSGVAAECPPQVAPPAVSARSSRRGSDIRAVRSRSPSAPASSASRPQTKSVLSDREETE